MRIKKVIKIDSNGFYVGDEILNQKYDEQGNALDWVIPSDCVETFPPAGLFKPKWTGTTWAEGATKEYIDQLKANAPKPPPKLEDVHAQLQNTQNALLAIMNSMTTKGGA